MIWELKALACLLLYPDEDLLESLPEASAALQDSAGLRPDVKEHLTGFAEWLRATPLTELQTAYVSTFDIGKRASLNLFEHTQGDSRERGSVMVELNRLYQEHGLDLATTELPDHLPVFLEFLAGLDRADAQLWLESITDPLRKIDQELQREESPWQAVTAAVLDFAGAERSAAPEAAADDLVPSVEAEYFEAPVTFGGSANPVG